MVLFLNDHDKTAPMCDHCYKAKNKREKTQKSIVRHSVQARQAFSLAAAWLLSLIMSFPSPSSHTSSTPLLQIWAATTQYLSQTIMQGHSTEGNLQVRGARRIQLQNLSACLTNTSHSSAD